jgi:hypothetical protein
VRPPTADEIAALLQPLPDLDRKIVAGIAALLMADPAQVRDQEQLARTFLQVAVVAHGFDAEDGPATTAHVEQMQEFARLRMRPILNAAVALFVRVADDLAGRPQATLSDARDAVAGYLAR